MIDRLYSRAGPSRYFLSRRLLLACAGSALAYVPGAAQAQTGATQLDPVVVTGGILRGASPGSIFIIGRRDLESVRPVSVSEALRQSPGIQVIDEDIFGLKLNISVRGLTPRRSGRTLLLEDGMPIHPAPYSEPSAHYSPSLGRIERIEILKGSGEVLEGPQSLGGMINFVTRPVPRSPFTSGELAFGTRNFAAAQLSVGTGGEHGGLALDATAKRSDGIRDGHETLFGEIAFKGQWDVSAGQGLTVRLTHHAEDTALTEAGLDARRFGANPYANPFENDRFRLERTAFQLVHDGRWSPNLRTRAQFYSADTFRASYRQTDTSTDAMTANPATGCIGAARVDYEGFARLCGNKMRPRDFHFQGLEIRAFTDAALWGAEHSAVVGARLHHEDVDRRRYNGLTADAREDTPGTVLRDHNQITTDAVALFALNTATWGPVSVSGGLRAERIVSENTSVVANFVPRGRSISKDQTIVLPGLGLSWRVDPDTTLFAGIHEGFAPPRPDRDVDPLVPANDVRPEMSINFEMGARSNPLPGVRLEGTIFAMDFSELIVAGPLLGLPSGTLVNAGKARHAGIELHARAEFGDLMALVDNPWVSLSLTHLATAEFRSDVGDDLARVKGNRIPYAPRLMVEASVGIEMANGLGVRLGLSHVGSQFADAANTITGSADGTLGVVPAHTTYSLAAGWQPTGKSWSLFLTGQNLTDLQYVSTRTDGLFAGPGRQIYAGLRWRR